MKNENLRHVSNENLQHSFVSHSLNKFANFTKAQYIVHKHVTSVLCIINRGMNQSVCKYNWSKVLGNYARIAKYYRKQMKRP